MIRLKDSYWAEPEVILRDFLWDTVFRQLFALFDEEDPRRDNIKTTALMSALKSGAIHYQAGVFSGQFNIATSKELSAFAAFDGRSKTWIGFPPTEIITEAQRIKYAARGLNDRISTLLPQFQTRIDKQLKDLAFPMKTVIVDLESAAEVEMTDLSVWPVLTESAMKRLISGYNENQQLNVKNWAPEQVERLRAMVEKNVREGYNVGEMRELLMNEWGVSFNKAKFLARQETSLFVSTFRDERYQSAGVEEYVWLSAHDSRCREANRYGGPAHGPGGPLHGHTFRFDDPPVSGTRGEKENPGVPYGCRCIARPVLPKR